MRTHCLFVLFVATPLSAAGVLAQPVHPGQTGTQLETLVRGTHSLVSPRSYSAARVVIFTQVDNIGGSVRLLYTGESFATPVVPPHNVVNVEHVWPQSRFGSSVGNKKSDLHHLFPTRSPVNTDRGNKPFAEIPDPQARKWWAGPTFLSGIPGSQIDNFSESTSQSFEPREADKGNVARAMFYFRAIYGNQGIQLDFFNQQRETLLGWHAADPADADELARNTRVAAVQGNRNPFVDDPTLATRMFAPASVTATASTASPAATTAATTTVTSATPTIQDGEEIHVMTWNVKFFYDADQSDNQSTLAKDQSADNDAEFVARLKKIAKVIKQAGLPQVVALQEVENKKVVERLAAELNATHGGKYKVGFVQGTDTFTEQDVAYLYEDRGMTVSFARLPPLPGPDSTITIPSKHCVMSVTHTLPTGQAQQLKLVNCHLKAGGGATNEGARMKQARAVSGFVTQTLTADPKTGVIVLGDMNAGKPFATTSAADGVGVMRGMETATPLDDLIDLNGDLSVANRATHASNKELDRILLSGAFLDDIGLVFQQVVVRRDLVTADVSDHFPMVATFVYRSAPGQ